jgi:hypothetical protein
LKYLEAENISLEEIDASKKQYKLGKAVFTPFDANDGGYVRTDAGGYQILSNFRNLRQGFRSISMTDVLEGQMPANLVRERIVLIGVTGESYRDVFFTPYSTYSSGWLGSVTTSARVEIHADLASQILSAALEGRPLMRVWSKPLEWLWIFGWSVVGGNLSWQFWRLRSPQGSVFSIFLAGVGLIGVCYGAFLVGWWLPLIPAVLALVGSAIMIPPIMSTSNQLKSLQLYRTLELTVEAYSENLADGRLAVEYFISSASRTKIAIQVLNEIAINTLDVCQTPEEIAVIYNQLAWIPSTSSNALDSVLRQFLEISQSVRVALDATSPQHQQELLAQPIARLHHLQESLNSKKDTHQRKALKKIAEYWLTILPTRG